MKKILLILSCLLAVVGMNAAEKSTTVVFKTNGTGDSSTEFTTQSAISDVVVQGTDFFSGITSVSKAYKGKDGYGMKFGSSKAAGNITFKLATKVKMTKVVVNAIDYSSDGSSIQINSLTAQKLSSDLADYEFAVTGEQESIKIASTTKRAYVKSITFYYESDEVTEPKFEGFQTSYNLAYGAEMALPEIAPKDLEYNFSVEDQDETDPVIVIEGGVIKAKKIGEATVNFTTEAVEGAYLAGEGSFKVNVVKANSNLKFHDQVVYGKLGVGVVWQAVIVEGPEDINSESQLVKYTSSNPEIVTVDEITGQIIADNEDDPDNETHRGVKAAGEVTITATFEGNDLYNGDSASYTIIIIDPSNVTDIPAKTAVFDFTVKDPYGMTSKTSGSSYETEVTEISEDVVSMSFSADHKYRSWTNTSGGNTSYELRYQTDNEGQITIQVPDTYKITKIGVDAHSSNYGGNWNPTSRTITSADTEEDWDVTYTRIWMPATSEGQTAPDVLSSVSLKFNKTSQIYKIYVQYELVNSNLQTPDLSFDQHIYAIYAGEEAEVNVANNSHNLDVHYSIQNLDADKYTITEEADKLLVTVSEPGYYTLEAKTDADETYRDGFAILRLNVYRHLDIDVDGVDLTEDVVNTSKGVTVNIENLDLVDVYYQIVEKGKEPVSADDDPKSELDENREPGFEIADFDADANKYFVDIEQGTEGELLFYIANYGYISPIRHIKLEDTRKEMSATFSVDDEMIYSTDDLVEIPVLFTPADTNDFPVATTFTLYEVGKEGAEKVDTDLYEMESNGAKVEGMISKAGVYTLVAEWKNDELYKDGETTSKAITIYAASMIGNNNKGVKIEGENVPEFVAPVEGSKVKTTALVFPEGSSDNKIKLSMNGADALYYFVVPVSSEDLNKPKTIDEAVAENQNPEGVENHFSKYDDAEGITLAGEHGRLHVQNITNGVVSPVEEALYTNDASKLADIETGVALVEIENGEAVYFDLNGVRVDAENIAPGIYVRVANGAAAKVLVK